MKTSKITNRIICFITILLCCTSLRSENKSNFTLFIYMNGSNLESKYKLATSNIEDIVQSITLPKETSDYHHLTILLLMGGTKQWHLGENISSQPIPSDSIVYARITHDGFQKIRSLKNQSIGDPSTLKEFIRYGTEYFPAERYGLIFWNHGAGSVTGFGYDELNPANTSLSLAEIRSGLAISDSAQPIPQFAFIGFDACLMATLETAESVSPYAKYLVASQELEPGKGWNYKSIISSLCTDPKIPDKALCRLIVDSFIEGYQDKKEEQVTLSVTDLKKVHALTENIKELSEKVYATFGSPNTTMSSNSYKKISGYRIASKSFGMPALTYYGPDMVDVLDFCRHISKTAPLTEAIKKNIEETVIYSRTSDNLKNEPICGLSVYFPCYNLNVAKNLTGYCGLGSEDGYFHLVTAFAQELVTGRSKEKVANVVKNNSSTLLSTEMILKLRKIYTTVQVAQDGRWISYGLDGADVTLNDEGAIIKTDKDKKIVEAWDQKWICIGDKPVTAYMMLSARKDSLVYTVPVTLNNEPCDLIIKYDNIKKSGSIYGARQTSNQLIPGKGMLEIKANDTITFRYEQFDDNDSINYIQSTDTIIVQQDRSNLSVRTTTVPKGKYRYGYCLVDLYGRKYYTQFTNYDVK